MRGKDATSTMRALTDCPGEKTLSGSLTKVSESCAKPAHARRIRLHSRLDLLDQSTCQLQVLYTATVSIYYEQFGRDAEQQ